MLVKLLNCGVDKAENTRAKQRVRLTNMMVVAFTPLTVFFIVLSHLHYPEIVWGYYLTLLISFSAIGANSLGYGKQGAFVVSILPTSCAFLVIVTTTGPAEAINPYFKLSMISFWIVPWLFFTFKEKWYLGTGVAYNLLLLLIDKPVSMALFIEGADFSMVHSAFFEGVLLFSGASAVLVGMFVFQLNLHKIDVEKDEVYLRIKSREEELSKSEVELKAYIQQQKDYKKEEEKQQWITAGLASVNEVIRKNNNELSSLSKLLVRDVVKYLGANQAGLFVTNGKEGKDEALELTACYAYSRNKYLKKEVLPGEGLVGQCFLEKEPIYLTEIPEGYMEITSGLGEASPRNVAIVPLTYDDKVVGVFELATFEAMEAHELKFIEKVAEGIGSVISGIQVNEKTKRLLINTQEQAEELRTREEEMRQNMEELQATQEAMQRKQQELEEMKSLFEQETAALKSERDELLDKLEGQHS